MNKKEIYYDKLLEEHFNDINDNEVYYFDPLHFGYDNDEATIKRTLNRIDYLLSLKNNDAYNYLWNLCSKRSLCNFDLNIIKPYATDRVFEFYKLRIQSAKIYKTINKCCYGNKDIIGHNVLLTSANYDDYLLIKKHFKEDGDYFNYSLLEETSSNNLNESAQSVYCTEYFFDPPKVFFIIKDNNSINKQTIGFVGCFTYGINLTYEISYYIFKPFRKKGLAKEAVKLFVDAVLNNRLYYPVKTKLDDVLKKKKLNISVLRCTPNDDNLPSNKLALSVGFKFVCKDLYCRYNPIEKKYISSNVYLISNNHI